VETLNNVLVLAREKPVNQLCEEIRAKVTSWYVQRNKDVLKWKGRIVPNVKDLLQSFDRDSWGFSLQPCGVEIFEVFEGLTKFVVNLDKRTCDCNYWQITGIPYKHGVRALKYMGMTLEDWVDEAYTIEKFKLAYTMNLNPVNDPKFWPPMPHLPTLLPPPIPKKRGRPRKMRRKGCDEQAPRKRSNMVRCGHCNELNHNVVGCPLLGKTPYKRKPKEPTGNKRGRPRKQLLVVYQPTNQPAVSPRRSPRQHTSTSQSPTMSPRRSPRKKVLQLQRRIADLS
jgi:hypothetical protein